MKTTRPDGEPALPDAPWHFLDASVLVLHSSSVKAGVWEASKQHTWHEVVRDHLELANKSDAPLWTFARGIAKARRNESVTHATALVYDVDGKAGADPACILDGLAGIAYWAHTTYSHRDDAPAFRIIIPLAHAIPADQYRDAWHAVAWILGLEKVVDKACKDIARLSYLPSCAPGAPRWQECSMDAPPIDWAGWMAVWQDAQAQKARRKAPTARPTLREITTADAAQRVELANQAIVARALETLSPAMPYDQWLRVCMACGETLGPAGIDAAREWSKGAPSQYKDSDWKSLRARFGG